MRVSQARNTFPWHSTVSRTTSDALGCTSLEIFTFFLLCKHGGDLLPVEICFTGGEVGPGALATPDEDELHVEVAEASGSGALGLPLLFACFGFAADVCFLVLAMLILYYGKKICNCENSL